MTFNGTARAQRGGAALAVVQKPQFEPEIRPCTWLGSSRTFTLRQSPSTGPKRAYLAKFSFPRVWCLPGNSQAAPGQPPGGPLLQLFVLLALDFQKKKNMNFQIFLNILYSFGFCVQISFWNAAGGSRGLPVGFQAAPRGSQATPGQHPGNSRATPRHPPGNSQATPRQLLGNSRAAPGQPPGSIKRPRGAKMQKNELGCKALNLLNEMVVRFWSR